MKFYFWLFDFLTRSLAARILGRAYGLRPLRVEGYRRRPEFFHAGPSPLWFHAASVGELEMLMPILDRALESGMACSVSAFSDSALPWLMKLQNHPRANLLRYVGLSPSEREWELLWSTLKVRQVWIAKYDFWPGMWAAASKFQIDVNVINARYRTSWSRLKSMMKWARISAPKIKFFSSHPARQSELSRHFPDAMVTLAPDPRRIRIRERAQAMNPQAEKVKEKIAALPKPVGIIGSAWPSDLQKIAELTQVGVRGSIVVFPHSFESRNLKAIREGVAAIARAHPIQTLVVEEKGILLESYAAADWAWVGGGFEHGIHSTLEPAFYGLPMIAGQKNAAKFDEIEELIAANQLTLCESDEQIVHWFERQQKAPVAKSQQISFPQVQQFRDWVDPWLAPIREIR